MKKFNFNKLIVLLVILVLISPINVMAQDEGEEEIPEEGPLTPDIFDKIQNPTPDQFNRLTVPTASRLEKVTNPTLENFNKLVPTEQSYYLGVNYNEEFADSFYLLPGNVGKNTDLDIKYFSIKGNIEQNRASASEFFTQNYGANYEIDPTSTGIIYSYDARTLTNGGKTIKFEQYRDRKEIIKIKTVEDGFIIIEEGKETIFIGEGEGTLDYEGEIGDFSFTDKEGVQHRFSRPDPGEVTFEVNEEIKVTGSADLSITIKGEKVRFYNFDGTAVFNPKTGEVKADNALYNEARGRLYLKGKFHITKDERTAKNLYAEVEVKTYSFGGKHTVMVDKFTTVGVKSQGQSEENGESVIVHLEALDPKKVDKPPIPTAEELQQRVEEIEASPRTDVGRNGEVWIKLNNDESKVVVEAKGKVDVGHYDVNRKLGYVGGLDETKPKFVGKNGKADFTFERNVNAELFEMRGLAEYSDGQLGKAENKYDGSIFRKIPSGFPNKDLFEVECAECSIGDVITEVSKRISIAREVSDDYEGLAEEIHTGSFKLNFKKIENGVKIETDWSELGDIADRGDNDFAVIGKDMYFKDTAENNFFGISQEGIGRYERREEGEFKPTSIDLGAKSKIGERLILVSDTEKENLDKFLDALEKGQIENMPNLGLTFSDSELREYIREKAGLDIFHLNDRAYINKIVEARKLLKKLEIKGVVIDLDGNCRSGCERLMNSRKEGGQLGWLYTAAMIQLANGQIKLLEAEADLAEKEGYSTLEIEENKRQLKNFINERIAEREGYAANYKLEQIKKGVVDLNQEEFSGDKDEVMRLKRERDDTLNKIAQNERDIKYLENKRKELLEKETLTAELVLQLKELKEQAKNLEKENRALRQEASRRESEAVSVALKHANTRPDVGGELCNLFGNAECTAINAQVLSDFAPELSNFYNARACLMVGNTVCARAHLAKVEDPDRKQEIENGILRLTAEKAKEIHREAQNTFGAVVDSNAQHEEARQSIFNKIPNLGWLWESQDEMNEERATQIARRDELNSRILVSLINSGYSPDEIRQLSEMEIEEFTGMDDLSLEDLESFYNYQIEPEFKIIADTYAGKEISKQTVADYYWDKAQISIKAAHLEESAGYPYYKYLAENFADIPLGQEAAKKVKLIEEGEAYTTSGGRLASAFLDVTWIAGGVFAGAKIAVGGVRTVTAGTKLATYGTKAGRVITTTGKIVIEPVKFVGRTAAKIPGAEKVGSLLKRTRTAFTSPNTKLLRAEREIAEEALMTSRNALQRAVARGESRSVIEGLEQVVAKEVKNLDDIGKFHAASKAADTTKGIGGLYRKATYAADRKLRKALGLAESKAGFAHSELVNAVTKFDDALKTGDRISDFGKLTDDVADMYSRYKKTMHSNAATRYFEEKLEAKQTLAEQRVKTAIEALPEGHVMASKCVPKCEVTVIGKTGDEVNDLAQQMKRTLRENGVVEEDFATALRNFDDPPLSQGEAILADGRLKVDYLREQALGKSTEGLEVSPALQNQKTDLLVRRDLEGVAEIEGTVIAITPTRHDVFGDFITKSTLTGIDDWAKGSDDLINNLRRGDEVQVATLDIHKFKDINTAFGHEGGNIFLRSTAEELEAVLKARGINARVYHKGGKTYKVVAANVEDDLSKVLLENIDTVRNNVVQKANAKGFRWQEDKFNFYIGVSERKKLTPGVSISEAEAIARDINFQSLNAGKYGQLEICTKIRDCTQIVRHGEVAPELRNLGIGETPIDLEQQIAGIREYEFFGENIKFDDLEGLLGARGKAKTLDEIKSVDYQILDKKLTYMKGDGSGIKGIFSGNEEFKTYTNYLLEEGGKVENRVAWQVGGDELAYVISRPAEEAVSLSRIDINFFGKTNLKYGIDKGNQIRDEAMAIMDQVLEDARLGKIDDLDDIIGKEIIKRFDDYVKREGLFVEGEIEATKLIKVNANVRPSLTIGTVKSDKNIISLTQKGEKNGASILNKVADEQGEWQKARGKRNLIPKPEEIKEINIDDFYVTAEIKQLDIDTIGVLVKTETDDIIIEFVHNGGTKPIFEEVVLPSLEGVIHEASAGVSLRRVVETVSGGE
ncbi:diguanylate cyclase [Candidatus Woesearchaeota archaeon]|nr:diguanylate cyclase [Candidatus Woesearchaeota archaeon]